MELVPVNSTMISAIGHDPTTNTLTVKFVSGPTWEYDDVPTEKYEQLLNADSVGKAFTLTIKNIHRGRRV